jgi:hypothetical protein
MAKKIKIEHETGAEELFRRLKANPPLFIGTVAVLVLVIVSFVLVPAIPDINKDADNSDMVFGAYNGIPIRHAPNNYFDRILQNIARAQNFSLESDYSADFEIGQRAQQIWQEAFYMTAVHEAVLNEMKEAGYTAPAAEVDREVAKLPEFQEDGRFSVTKYRRFPKDRLQTLWKTTEQDYTDEQYRAVYSGLLVSEAEKTFIGNMSSPERSFVMAAFPRSSYPDSEIAAYAASEPAPFKMVHLSKITVDSSEREAQQILDSIKSGKTQFEEAARNQSKDSYRDQGGDMGVRMAHELYSFMADATEAQRNAVLALRPGEFSDVIKDPGGWAFYRAEETPYNADFSVQENVDKARSYMSQQAGGRMEDWLVARAEEFINKVKETDFERAAEAAGLEVKRFGPVSLNYGNVPLFYTLDTSAASGLSAAVRNENFWKIAFTTPVGLPSAPFTLETDVVVLAATEETVQDDTAKGYVSDFYASNTWLSESDLRAAVRTSKKMEDNFFITYFTRILSPFANVR